MPTCQNCQTNFPNYVVIDGIQKRINKRKYCLDCSPYKQHNTKRLQSATTKTCPNCKVEKAHSEFYARSKGRPSNYCIDCSKVLTHERMRQRKRQCIEYLGGSCVACGYKDHDVGFDFHHLDRTTKNFQIGNKLGMSFNNLKPELDKCVLVCCRCHREIEAGLKTIGG